jgi:hypothetical protein
MKTFNIGDVVWIAVVTAVEKSTTCPDCFGKRFLKVILGNDSVVTVDCPECQRGCYGSQGEVRSHEYAPKVEEVTVTGVEKEGERLRYRFFGHYNVNDCDVFANREGAEARMVVLAREKSSDDAKRFVSKEKPTRTWAYNATYHRGCIRRAERELAYHRSKLEVCKLNCDVPITKIPTP